MAFHSSLSLRRQLFYSSLFSFAVLGVLIAFLYSQLVESSSEKSDRYVHSVFDQFFGSLVDQQEGLARLLVAASNDPSLQAYVSATTPADKFAAYTTFSSNISTYLGLTKGIEDFMVIAPVGNSFAIPSNPDYQKLVLDFAATLEAKPRSSTLTKISLSGSPTYSLLVGTKAEAYYLGSTVPVSVILRINVQSFFPDYGSLPFSSDGRYTVTDRAGTVISGSDLGSLYLPAPQIDDRHGKLSKTLPILGGQAELEVPKDFLLREIIQTQVGSFLLFTGIYLGLLIINLLIIANINRTHKTLVHSIREIRTRGEGRPDQQIVLSGFREAEILAQEFNGMNASLLEMKRQVVEEQTAVIQLELRARVAENEYLLAQINPHFLYNSFETIKGMAHLAGHQPIVEITSALTRIFRYSLKAGAQVAFREELETIRAYLMIQQVRFAGRFEVEFDIEDGALDCLVPKMILQPLVENAIVHGLERVEANGRLVIMAHRSPAGVLRVRVEDNGAGIPAGRLKSLLDDLEKNGTADSSRPHVGLKNVRERLRLAYGQVGVFEIHSTAASPGTKILLQFPAGEARDLPCSGS